MSAEKRTGEVCDRAFDVVQHQVGVDRDCEVNTTENA